jgi:hypothetical protein
MKDQDYEDAIIKFLEKEKKDKNVIGILICGSYIHSKLDKNSDLDFHIILNNKVKTRERGNTWINGIEIEYFKNPVNQIKHYLKTENGAKAPCTAHMFVNSRVLYKKGNELDKLIKESKKILEIKPKPINKTDIEIARYFIDDIEKDLEDVYIKKDEFAFELIANKILEHSLNLFCKIKRIFPEKSKRLFNYIKDIDNNFAELYSSAILEKNINKKYHKLIKLIRYIEHNLGGKRPKEWKLKTKCDYMKK